MPYLLPNGYCIVEHGPISIACARWIELPPVNGYEYLWDNHLLHYDPALPENQVSLFFGLMGNWANFNEAQDEFCRRARHGRSGVLKDDLYFNIVDLLKAPITTR
jgi:hypothetical protein